MQPDFEEFKTVLNVGCIEIEPLRRYTTIFLLGKAKQQEQKQKQSRAAASYFSTEIVTLN